MSDVFMVGPETKKEIEPVLSARRFVELVKWPAAVLATATTDVVDISALRPHLLEIERRMKDVLAPLAGYALAAPQAGFSVSMVVTKGPYIQEMTMVNPRILRMGPKRKMREGCLSTPGFFMEVERAEQVTFEFYSIEGTRVQVPATGVLAQVIQHETDHLKGKVIVDSLPPLRRKRLEKQFAGSYRTGR